MASMTPATTWLARHGVRWREHVYAYVDRGGTGESARQLGVPEHRIVKTLVMVDEQRAPLLVLMHGDRTVSTRRLARALGCRSIAPADPGLAQRVTGCQVGGISPFNTKRAMRTCVERGILALESILINGGRRGYLIEIDPAVLLSPLGAVVVDCGLEEGGR
ncbi:MAG: aminoacyl-tRNA deacylase [Lautropia sp.]